MFICDHREVQLGNVVSEVVLSPVRDHGGVIVQPDRQFSRTPYLVGFRCGFARFMLASVHIDWGASKAEPANRVREIENLAAFMRARTEDPHSWSQNVILIGDFSIWDASNEDTMKALLDHGFMGPTELRHLPSNACRTRHYDQIAFRVNPDRLARQAALASSTSTNPCSPKPTTAQSTTPTNPTVAGPPTRSATTRRTGAPTR